MVLPACYATRSTDPERNATRYPPTIANSTLLSLLLLQQPSLTDALLHCNAERYIKYERLCTLYRDLMNSFHSLLTRNCFAIPAVNRILLESTCLKPKVPHPAHGEIKQNKQHLWYRLCGEIKDMEPHPWYKLHAGFGLSCLNVPVHTAKKRSSLVQTVRNLCCSVFDFGVCDPMRVSPLLHCP
eukprot:3189847-Rhodomonas_salina.1